MPNLSTRMKITVLIFCSFAFLAGAIGIYTSYRVQETVSDRLRENSSNAVRLSAANARDLYQSLFRDKVNRVFRLKEMLHLQEQNIRAIAEDDAHFFPRLRGLALPDGISLWVVDDELSIRFCSGKVPDGFNPFASEGIKGRAVGANMLRLARSGSRATALVRSVAKDGGGTLEFFGQHFFLEKQGLLVGLWVNIESQMEEERRGLAGAIETLTETFRSIHLGESGFLMVIDGNGASVILPVDEMDPPDMLLINPLNGKTVLDNIKDLAASEDRYYRGPLNSLINSHEIITFVDYVRPLDWYIIGFGFVDEIERSGRNLSLSLVVFILMVSICLAIVALMAVGRLIAPLVSLARFARKVPEIDFFHEAGDNDLLERIASRRSGDEIAELAQALQFMDGALRARVRELVEAAGVRERMEGELRTATQIQMNFLPKPLSVETIANRFELASEVIPAREVGGDLYDFFMLDENRICLVIGDVSGKGVPAALFMSMTLVLLRSCARSGVVTPEELISEVNQKLAQDNSTNMFVTLFVAIVDLRTGEVSYANAGHNPPLVASSSGVRRVEGSTGFIAGVMDDVLYAGNKMVIKPNEVFFMYTDGVSEAMNENGKLFGEDTLDATVAACCSDTPEDILHKTLMAVARHVGKAPASDDITLLCFSLTCLR